jgi:hypothetical protein
MKRDKLRQSIARDRKYMERYRLAAIAKHLAKVERRAQWEMERAKVAVQ